MGALALVMAADERREAVRRLLPLGERAYRLALCILDSSAAAEDVVQQAYLSALLHVPEGLSADEARAWFLKVVANAARKHARGELRRKAREAAVMGEREGGQSGQPGQPDAEMTGALRIALRGLDEKHRLPVALCCEQGMSHAEAAEILDVPKRTLSRRVGEGLEELRGVLSRAGYAAAPAAIAAGLAQAAAPMPAGLSAALERIVSEGAVATTSPAPTNMTGGLLMKIGLGAAALGLAAGATFWAAGGRAEDRPAPIASPAAGETKDPPEDQKYSLRLLVWNFWSAQCGMLDGPAGMAESTDLIKGHDVDNAGNVYWTECDSPVIRRYSPKTDRVETIAGGIRGLADGPLDTARFGGWSYNSTNLICVSGDGKHLFVRDVGGKGQWRYVDLENKTVTSLGQWHHFKGGYFVIAKDRSGDVYAFVTSGEEPPDCKGYKKLKVAPCLKDGWFAFDRYALDAEKMKFYFHLRGPVTVLDLKTGQGTVITANGRDARPINTSGPLETTTFLCPTGMSISPAGRYVYVGQGDGSSCFRLDMEKKQALIWGSLDGGGFGWREGKDRDKNCMMTGTTGWPAAVNYIPDGRGYWANCWGLYALTPIKGGN